MSNQSSLSGFAVVAHTHNVILAYAFVANCADVFGFPLCKVCIVLWCSWRSHFQHCDGVLMTCRYPSFFTTSYCHVSVLGLLLDRMILTLIADCYWYQIAKYRNWLSLTFVHAWEHAHYLVQCVHPGFYFIKFNSFSLYSKIRNGVVTHMTVNQQEPLGSFVPVGHKKVPSSLW